MNPHSLQNFARCLSATKHHRSINTQYYHITFSCLYHFNLSDQSSLQHFVKSQLRSLSFLFAFRAWPCRVPNTISSQGSPGELSHFVHFKIAPKLSYYLYSHGVPYFATWNKLEEQDTWVESVFQPRHFKKSSLRGQALGALSPPAAADLAGSRAAQPFTLWLSTDWIKPSRVSSCHCLQG